MPAVREPDARTRTSRALREPPDRRSAIPLLSYTRPRARFDGGLYLPRTYALPPRETIRDLAVPSRIRIPLERGGVAATPVVEPGVLVESGECIAATPGDGRLCVCSPCCARVVGTTCVDTAHQSEVPAMELLAVAIDTDPPPEASATSSLEPPRELAGLIAVADRAGVTDFARSPRPLSDLLKTAGSLKIRDLIINGLCPEPVLTGGQRLLLEHLDAVVGVAGQLKTLLKARRAWLAVERGREIVSDCRAATSGTPVRLIPLEPRYPQASPVLLTYVITGRETPCGAAPVSVGAVVIDVRSLVALSDALIRNRPLTHATLVFTGPAAARAGYYRVPIGISYADLLGQTGIAPDLARVVDGGLLSGASVPSLDAVVTESTRGVILLDRAHDRIPTPGPCIRCGFCQEDCPVGLDPQALLRIYETERFAAARALHPEACIACGLCSYVCPAELPLAAAATRLKQIAAR